MADITELTEDNFQAEVLQSSQPVLVDFWAPWCGPCLRIAPLVEQLAAENAGTARFGKVNVDSNQNLAASYGVSSIPTLIVFKDGQVASSFVGLQPKDRLQQALDDAAA